MFPPIAIVGHSCILPGALSPQAFWDALVSGKDLLSSVPDGYWRVPRQRILCAPEDWSPSKIWSDRGGYVLGFEELFDPTGFGRPAHDILELDTQVHWLLHTAREALTEVGVYRDGHRLRDRVGLIFGNLGYPTFALNEYAESLWSRRPQGAPDPRNRFHPGLSGHYAAECLGLTGDAWCLDAACASSLYAFKLACDQLHDCAADIMLAGAVNGCDDLGIHTGFCSLQALSRTGQSRPFHNQADGLVPAEGAALFALMRLEDAIGKGLKILGVIRGIGLANDGRQGGFLSPNVAGQVRALRQAYATAGLRPQDISYVECHATGTAGGDGIELQTLREVFTATRELRIGSHKSNVGHLITSAGAAGLLKILASFEHATLAPNRHTDDLREAARTPPLRVVTERESWGTKGPRRAGLNAFGFGGTNAHLIVEEGYAISGPGAPARKPLPASSKPSPAAAVAVVGIAIRTGNASSTQHYERLLFGADSNASSLAISEVNIDARRVSFPPRDLDDTLPQQILMLTTALDAAAGCSLPADATGVFVGATCDTEACRWVARARATALLPDSAELVGLCGERTSAATVVGCMPNISANRINFQLDLLGPGFTCFAEELSGIRALASATQMIRHGDLKAAIVGAVDLAVAELHTAAARQVLPTRRQSPGDAAVALVLKNLDDAQRDGDTIIAILEHEEAPVDDGTPILNFRLDEGNAPLTPLVGHAHAASGLLLVASSALALRHRVLPTLLNGEPAWPWLGLTEPRRAHTYVTALGGQHASVKLREADPAAPPLADRYLNELPKIHTFSGRTRADIIRALANNESGASAGPMRLALVATGQEFEQVRQQTLRQLRTGEPLTGEQESFFHESPIGGRIALFCSSAAGVYRGMGAELYRAFNDLVQGNLPTRQLLPRIARAHTRWCDPAAATDGAGAFDRIVGARFLSTIHGVVAREILGIPYDAAMGLSSGETDIMFAINAADIHQSMTSAESVLAGKLFDELLSGRYEAVKQAWGLPPEARVDWSMWRVVAPSARVLEAAELEPWAHVAIVNTPSDVVLAGDRSACLRILEQIDPSSFLEIKGYDLAYHVPEVHNKAADILLRSHSHVLNLPPGIAIYSSAWTTAYKPSTQSYAEAIVAQATATVNLPALVHQAYADGIRIFVEFGPRNVSAGWIRQILHDQPHLAVSFNRSGVGDLRQIALAGAELFAAGVDLNVDSWNARMEALEDAPRESATTTAQPLTFPGHWGPVVFPPDSLASEPEEPLHSFMPAAPPLPPVLGTRLSAAGADFDPLGQTPSIVAGPRATPGTNGHGEYEPATRDAAYLRLTASISEQTETFVNHVHNAHRGHSKFLELRRRMRLNLLQSNPYGPTCSDPRPEAAQLYWANTIDTAQIDAPAPGPPGPVFAPANAFTDSTDIARDVIVPLQRRAPVGPSFDRDALLILAGGKISQVFGPLFEKQDGYHRQTRLPEPPLLLVDRITGLEAEAGVHGTGTVWTETDVRGDAWYLHHGMMPAGVMVESGQADLTLISYMGTDFQNRGERVYRLLGCQLTYHRGLPRAGETLKYQIEVDHHAQHGDVRIFFFNYDCTIDDQLAMTVRRGHAGFFTDEELVHSAGVLWEPETGEYDDRARLDPPVTECQWHSFDAERVQAFFDGRVFDCFGSGYQRTHTHTRTPQAGSGRMQFFQEVPEFDPVGGPWGRGYLRARWNFHPDDWFLPGHFKNDPCMPGTLMLEGAFQAMAFYMTALGYTLDKDGWRFEPVQGTTFDLRCRGQATPSSKHLDCELFVEEVHGGPEPALYVDVLGTVDGLKALYCRRLGLKLVPDFPLSDRRELIGASDSRPPTATLNGIPLNYESLLHCAIGDPTAAFGEMARAFSPARRCPRLPGPPYHFMTRITRLETQPNEPQVGGWLELEYDIPPDAWYFRAGGNGAMPFSVLLEANLQPCGWLAVCGGVPFKSAEDQYFRNLDGVGHVYKEVLPASGKLITRIELTACSAFGNTTILQFTTDCSCGGDRVAAFDTSFGFFTREALAQQVGLPPDSEELAAFSAPGARCPWPDFLAELPSADLLQAHDGRLGLLQHLSGYWPEGGKARLGRLRAERHIDASDWYFKAHFYQDPVQPGSLGIEAMLQLVRALMLRSGLGAQFTDPRFESISLGDDIQWSYRGQVLANNEVVTVDAELVDVLRNEQGVTGVADTSLWVDGLRIYQANRLAVKIVEGTASDTGVALPVSTRTARHSESVFTLNPTAEPWLLDHRPNFVIPVAPMMWMVDTMAQAAHGHYPAWKVCRIEDFVARRWLACDQPRKVRIRCTTAERSPNQCRVHVELDVWRNARPASLSRFESLASTIVVLTPTLGEAPSHRMALGNPEPVELPYRSKRVFHGRAWQLMTELHLGDLGAWSMVNSKHGSVPFGHLGFPILDMLWHSCELRNIHRWCPTLPKAQIYLPSTIEQLEFFAPIPENQDIRCEVQFDAFDKESARLWLNSVMLWQGRVLLRMRVSELPIPYPFPSASEAENYGFLHDHAFFPDLWLSTTSNGTTQLDRQALAALDAIPGTASEVYSVSENRAEAAVQVAAKEHAARIWRVHPRWVEIDPSLTCARMNGGARILELSVHETTAFVYVSTKKGQPA